jgi:hypothetical protein
MEFFDSNKQQSNQILYVNKILSSDTIKYSSNSFIPAATDTTFLYPDTTMYRDRNDNPFFEVQAGEENSSLFATQIMNFGGLDAEPGSRTNQLNTYISIIERYPSSQYLLSLINENKSMIYKNELELMLKHFSSTALQSGIGKTLVNYVRQKVDMPVFSNETLDMENGELGMIYNMSSKINVIVFWASWCAPCRA